MSDPTEPLSEGSSARVLWCVAVTKGPTTAHDVSEILGVSKSSCYTSLKRLYRSGLIEQTTVVSPEQGRDRNGYRLKIPD